MNLRFAGALVGAALVATACSGSSKSVPLSAPASPTVAPHVWTRTECQAANKSDWTANCQQFAVKTEGSVLTDEGKWVEWPDGLRVTFVKAETRPDSKPVLGVPDAPTTNRVRVTFQLKNDGPQPVAIVNWDVKALGGDNQFSLKEDHGFMGETEANNDQVTPARLIPGSSFQWYRTFNVPPEYRSVISITVQHPTEKYPTYDSNTQSTPFTFNGVGNVLK